MPNDPVQAYIWFGLAAAQGDADAVLGRERVAKTIDPTLRHQADAFVTTWKPAR